MNKERVLVTGGAGYIGAHTCMLLAEAGHEPVALDNLTTGRRNFARFGPLIEADLRDREQIIRVISETRPDAIMHLAASTSVSESVMDPELYWTNNFTGTWNLVSAAEAAGCTRIVFASTSAVYGSQPAPVLAESAPSRPTNAYAASKLASEHMLDNLALAGRISALSLRYFNVAGADPKGRIGDNSRPGTALIPTVISSLGGHGSGLQVNGTDYETPDGTCIRDYIHVMDVARANIAAMHALADREGHEVLNIGTGRGFSILEIINSSQEVTNRRLKFYTSTRRPGDIARTIADCTRAGEVLGFGCRYSGIDTIIRDAWNWHNGGKGAS